MNGLVFDPLLPPPAIILLAGLLVAATWWIYRLTAARLSLSRQVTLLVLRLAAVLAITLILLQPSRHQSTQQRRQSRILLVGLDVSKSMNQKDAGDLSRFAAARQTIENAGLSTADPQLTIRWFAFAEDAAALTPAALNAATATGASTHIHHSVQSMLASLKPGETGAGLVLLTDGHDFGITPASRTAASARLARVPIHAVPFGDQGLVRDVSVTLANFEPYSYVKQKARITAQLRLIGCEHEDVAVGLYRENRLVKSVTINAGQRREFPVEFIVTEPETGQVEYEIRAQPLKGEIDANNNSTLTYLNVIDQRIRVLTLEGDPYWDTTFLRRSLGANDKIALDSAVRLSKDRLRLTRKENAGATGPVTLPSDQAAMNAYDIVILGKSVDRLLQPEQISLLKSFVRDHGGALIFSRGQAFEKPSPEALDLDPVLWSEGGSDHVRLQVALEGRSLSPFRVLLDHPGGPDALPELLTARHVAERKALAAIVAESRGGNGTAPLPGMIHRRYGRGQVLSVAVAGLWKWSFNAQSPGKNTVFDRFWDQLTLWLVASGDFQPSQTFSFRASTANIPLGAPMHLRLTAREEKLAPRQAPVTIFESGQQVARIALAPADPADPSRLTADYLPAKPGRYRAVVDLPNEAQQEIKWMVFEDRLEEKEVAADTAYLRELTEASSGKLLAPGELRDFVERLRRPDSAPSTKVQRVSVWDRAWVFYLIAGALALDWWLRRRWGLC